ncbi:Protein PDC2 [Spathaspora sp. JA1]|nr:Protein PDC2 [Spathaspora sp. JA1]
MGYTIKQKIDICLKAEANPQMTQSDLATWAMKQYGTDKPPSQTTISRILSCKNDLIASKETDFQLVRRRQQLNPLLRRILTEWITQAIWENIPITTPIIQSTANAIWTRLPQEEKEGNGSFNLKWCNYFIKKLNINLTGGDDNPGGYPLNKVWKLDEKIALKQYLNLLIEQENYTPQDIFVIDEFQLFYSLPLDQIFDVSSIDKGLKQSSSSTENSLTIMLGCNIDGSEKLSPLIVGKYDKFDVSKTTHSSLKNISIDNISHTALMNKLTEAYRIFYKSNTNKWITSSMFQHYLLTLDHKISNVTPNRKILILLDDCSSHRIINVKFNHIRLVYLKNDINKSPYGTSYSGSKFDYLPMNFGIIEEFKILYRLQQYLEMINLQRNNSKLTTTVTTGSAAPALEVLSEGDYHIPMIRVIEWITRSWHSITPERIFSSWKKTNLFKLEGNNWPSLKVRSNAEYTLLPLITRMTNYDETKSYNKLEEIMGYLNVVIPWEIDELLGLVNERGKVTLSYASITEIIGSCLSESYDRKQSTNLTSTSSLIRDDQWFANTINEPADNSLLFFNSKSNTFDFPYSEESTIDQLLLRPNSELITPAQQITPPGFTSVSPILSTTSNLQYPITAKHKLPDTNDWLINKKRTSYDYLTSPSNRSDVISESLLSNEQTTSIGSTPGLYQQTPTLGSDSATLGNNPHHHHQQDTTTGLILPSSGNVNEFEIITCLNRIIEVGSSSNHVLKLSNSTLEELQFNLQMIQGKFNK